MHKKLKLELEIIITKIEYHLAFIQNLEKKVAKLATQLENHLKERE